ncbi:hypothetical protein ACFXJ8_16390 [Nonomuraea sp. NPDC059194]|uniref:hypothetical protein n=1 Tax=Nonomuraea sp. NPDC059194 TaxID=3346764 RepID=UPI0036A9D1D2
MDALLRETDWHALRHAYGDASDAPDHLRALIGDDPERRAEAVAYLDAAILHQGSADSATAPVALVVARLLGHPRLAEAVENIFPWDDEPRPLRSALLDFLAGVAEACDFGTAEEELLAAAYPEGRAEADLQRLIADFYAAQADFVPGKSELPAAMSAAWKDPHLGKATAARSVLGCRAVAGDLLDNVLPFLDDADEAVRIRALNVITHLLPGPSGETVTSAMLARLDAASVRERAQIALALGHGDAMPYRLLTDDHPAVRACAALSPGLAADDRATAELLSALADPRTADSWFDGPLPHVDGWFRFALVKAAVARVATFEDLLPAALAIVPLASSYTVDSDWGPLLKAAFPEPATTRLSAAQHALLTALVDNAELWTGVANPIPWLREAGLPEDRESYRDLL